MNGSIGSFRLGNLDIDPRAGWVTGPGGRESLAPRVMPPNTPRRDWHSSITDPMYSLGVMIEHLVMGSRISAILPAGQSDGFVTT